MDYSKKMFFLIALFLCLRTLSLASPQSQENSSPLGNSFTLALTTELLQKENSTVTFSPYSLFAALSMVYCGAAKETYEEIQKILALEENEENFLSSLATLNTHLSKHLTLSSHLWIDHRTSLLPTFQKALEKGWQSLPHSVDFVNKPTETLKTINDSIRKSTDNKIQDLLSPGDITPFTRLILTHTIYFHGVWASPFLQKMTQEEIFYGDSGEKLVPMMHKTETMPYFSTSKWEAITLDLQESPNLLVLLILPKEGYSTTDCIDALSLSFLDTMTKEKVSLSLPRFSLSSKGDFSETLHNLGIERAFSPYADFSRIDGSQDLYLSKVLHECILTVDEKGLTAAAATAPIFNTKAVYDPRPSLSFTLNRPFLFCIIDKNYKINLFIGKISNPTSLSQEEEIVMHD